MLQQCKLGDCLEVMKEIPDQSINLILTDPPYGVSGLKWDRLIDFRALWVEFERILATNGTVVMTSTQPLTTQLIYIYIYQVL